MATSPEQLEAWVTALRENRVLNERLYHIISEIGRSDTYKPEADTLIAPFLDHPESDIRAIAILVLGHRWRLVAYYDRCVAMFHSDHDENCRRKATLCIGSLKQATYDPTTLVLLAAKVQNEHENIFVRETAYLSILYVLGDWENIRRLYLLPWSERIFEAGLVDWELVKRVSVL